MKTCLVSLISDQTPPNILVAAHYKADFLLFITTPSMEKKGKSQAILEVLRQRGLDYLHAFQKIEVSEDSVLNFQTEVSAWLDQAGREYRFIVNLTGGNKLMAIAAFDLFSGYDSIMGYIPIPRNEFLIPFPKKRPKGPVALLDRLSVAEYLTAYGFTITNRTVLKRNKKEAFARDLISEYIFDHYEDVRPLLKSLGDNVRLLKEKQVKKGYVFCGNVASQNDAQEKLLCKLGFQRNGLGITKKINKSEWNFLRGGWLEERLFLALNESLPRETDIQLAVVSKDPKGNKNEFDIIFTYENVLFLVECKSLDVQEGEGGRSGVTINDFLYKLGALRQNFGLTPRAFLATTSRNIFDESGRIKSHLIERGKQFSTQIIPLLQVKDPVRFFRERFNTL